MRIKSAHLLATVLIIGAGTLGVMSRGFLEADEVTHLLKSRDAIGHPELFIDIWARPLCVTLFAIPAMMGGWALIAARLVAVVVTGLTGWGAWRLYLSYMEAAAGREDFPGLAARPFFGDAWVWGLFFAQPLVLLNAFTVMTEMQLACLWVWAAVCVFGGKWKWAGLLVGIGALARPEGCVAVAVWPIVVWGVMRLKRRGVASVGLAILPAMLWWVAGAVMRRDGLWMLHAFPWQVQSQYGRTGLLFVASAVASGAGWIWVPIVVGAVSMVRRDRLAGWMIVLPILGFFAMHGVLGTFGLMGSMSLPRYFICVAPFMSVAGVMGLNRLLSAEGWVIGRPKRAAWVRKGAILLAVLPAMGFLMLGQLPVPASTVQRQMDAAITAFEQHTPHALWNERLTAAHPYVYYRTQVSLESPAALRVFSNEAIRNAPSGTCLITDPIVWDREGHPSPTELQAWGYRIDPLAANGIQGVPIEFSLSMIGMTPSRGIGVDLWVKE